MTTDLYFDESVKRLITKNSNRFPNTLSLVHGTTAFDLRQILRDGFLKANMCEVVNEKVVFTFYGRPAYKINDSGVPLNQTLNAPVYLLLKKQLFKEAVTGFPFDSGAFAREFYRHFVEEKMTLESFKFEPSENAVKAILECYFESNIRYLNNNPLRAPNVTEGDFEATVLANLLNRTNINQPLDDRASTIEIGLAKDVTINKENIEAIILPQQLADSGDIGAKIKHIGIEAYFYDFINGYSWDQYIALILAQIKDHYASLALI